MNSRSACASEVPARQTAWLSHFLKPRAERQPDEEPRGQITVRRTQQPRDAGNPALKPNPEMSRSLGPSAGSTERALRGGSSIPARESTECGPPTEMKGNFALPSRISIRDVAGAPASCPARGPKKPQPGAGAGSREARGVRPVKARRSRNGSTKPNLDPRSRWRESTGARPAAPERPARKSTRTGPPSARRGETALPSRIPCRDVAGANRPSAARRPEKEARHG